MDVLLVIWRDFLCAGPERARFVLSKGHAAAALYAVMVATGHLDPARLAPEAEGNGSLPAHPEYDSSGTLSDFSTGSLGQGLSAALGMALVKRPQPAWVLLGDGECQEGQVWEAAMLAARLGLGNLLAVVDCNGLQEWGYSDGPPVERLAEKWAAFGWRVREVDGHDPAALTSAFSALADAPADRPSVVLARTIKGRGFPLIERDPVRFHCGTLEPDEYAACLA